MEERVFTIPISNGLLKGNHRERMGSAIWEFLWCVDRTTKEYIHENGEARGVVLGGKPILAQEVADELNEHLETAKRNLRKLQQEGYIYLKRTPKGNIIEVCKSKKTSVSRIKNDSSNKKGESKNASSDESKMLLLGERRYIFNRVKKQKRFFRRNKNASSNKTFQLDNTKDIKDLNQQQLYMPQTSIESEGEYAVTQTNDSKLSGGVPTSGADEPEGNTDSVEFDWDSFNAAYDYACKKLQRHMLNSLDQEELKAFIQEGISVDTIQKGIELTISEYIPAHKSDKVRTVRYCSGKIRDLYYKASQGGMTNASDKAPARSEYQKRLGKLSL